jgi:hypothetical protein
MWLITTIVAAVLKPSPHGHGTHQQLGMAPCPSVLLFDRPCPGCGMTTSWTALVHGDLAGALHAHALGPITYLAFTLTAIAVIVAYARGQRLRTDTRAFNRGLVAFAVVYLGYGVVRMLTTTGYRAPHESVLSRVVAAPKEL